MITTILRRRFVYNPYLLSESVKHFSGLENTLKFYDMVKDYLPEELPKMLTMVPEDAAEQFVKLFSKQYFPIEGRKYTYVSYLDSLVDSILLEWRSLEEFDYEKFKSMSGAQLLAESILPSPFERTSRVAVVDQLASKYKDLKDGEKMLNLIANSGWDPEDVEDTLQDSPYQNFIPWVQWVFARTGNLWLDTKRYHAAGRIHTAWEKDNVLELARHWQLYLKIKEDMDTFSDWLKIDFPGRSAEVIKYIHAGFGKRLINVLSEVKHDNQS